MLPYQEIFLWSLGLSVITVLMSKFLGNQHEVKKAKKEMEFHRDKASKAQKAGDLKKANEHMSEMLKASQTQFRHNLKPMMLSFMVFILALGWMNTAYAEVMVNSPVPIPFVADQGKMSWFWWYIILILPMSMVFRKILDVV